MATYNFTDRIKGDTSKVVEFTLLKDTVPVDLTGASIRMQLRKSKTSGSIALTLHSGASGGIIITSAAAGIFQIDAFTVEVAANTYVYDIEITLSTGEIKTWIEGEFNVLQDITR